MARDLNIWIGTGHLGRDPELKKTGSDKSVCTVAMGCSFDDKTEWVNLVFWEKTADMVVMYCKKGSFIRVSGRLQTRTWDDKDGVKRYMTEIVANDVQFLDKKADSGAGATKDTGSRFNKREDEEVIPF